MPVSIYVVYTTNNLLNITWLFLWDRSIENIDFLIPCVVVMALMAVSLYVCIGISSFSVDQYYPLLQKDNMLKEAWMIRFMVHNALAFYAAWTSVATMLNLAACITYRGTTNQNISSTIVLSILAIEIVLWFILDTFVLDRYVRFLFAPYIVLIWSLTGSVYKNYAEGERNAIFTVAMLGFACVALVVKVTLMTWRGIRRPLYTNSISLVTPADGKENSGYDMNDASGKNM